MKTYKITHSEKTVIGGIVPFTKYLETDVKANSKKEAKENFLKDWTPDEDLLSASGKTPVLDVLVIEPEEKNFEVSITYKNLKTGEVIIEYADAYDLEDEAREYYDHLENADRSSPAYSRC